MELAKDMLLAAEHPSLEGYRERLGMLANRGANVSYAKDGFELSDRNHIITVKYPKYAILSDFVERTKTAARQAFEEAGLKEYAYSVNDSKENEAALLAAVEKANEALETYHAALLYDRALNSALVDAAKSSAKNALTSAQEAYSEALADAREQTNDAKQEPMFKQAIEARANHVAITSSMQFYASCNNTVVVDIPKISEESTPRRQKRLQTMQRNKKIEQKERLKDKKVSP